MNAGPYLLIAVMLDAASAMAHDTAMPVPVPVVQNAETRVEICYNYGCLSHAEVEFASWQLAYLDRLFAGVRDAADERRVLGRAIGRMYFFAGASTPIWHDHGLNYKDDGVDGKMDCIDHSHNTNEFLLLLKSRGLLRFHEVHGRLKRTSFLIADHWTARVADSATGAEYAVDSWYFDPGEPAAVMPIADWLHRKDPRG